MKRFLIAALLSLLIPAASAQQAGNGPPVPTIQPAPQAPPISGNYFVTPQGGNTPSPLPNVLGRIVTPLDFGAKGDGVTNDTTAVQNAINYLEGSGTGGTLYLGQYQYCINTINITGTIRIIGSGTNGQNIQTTGFRACSANLTPMINITGTGVTLENFGINMQTPNGTFSNSGETLLVQGFQNVISHIEITDPCIGIIENGNSNQYEYNEIASFYNNLNVSACGGIQIGTLNGGPYGHQSIDAILFANTIVLASANSNPNNGYGWGMLFTNAGGTYVSNNSILFTQVGTSITPYPNKTIQWLQFDNTVLGDETSGDSLIIQPQGTGAILQGFFCTACWSGSAGNWKGAGTWYTATGAWIHNDNGGTVSGISINAFKQNGSYADGLDIGPNVNDVQIIGGQFCDDGISTPTTANAILSNGNNVIIKGNYIAANCFGYTQSTGIYAGLNIAAGGNYVIQGNWIGADDNGTKNVNIGISIASGTGTVCEGNNYINAKTNTSFYTGFASTCY